MAEKRYCLTILYAILCIHQILADEALDNLVRRKRVINLEPDGDVPLQNGNAPYIVNIRRVFNNSNIGVGAILSKHTIITTASCVASFPVSSIKVLAGSVYYYRGAQHDVLTKTVHLGNHQRSYGDGVALLTVVPAIIFDTKTSIIHLHQGPLSPGMSATIFGWGCNPTLPRGTNFRDRLRSITVPIMNHMGCVNSYRNRVVISINDICTYDAQKRCGHSDLGAPLVVNNQLVGLHLWRTEIPGRISPDVFVVLQSLEYATWIRNNIIYNVVHMGRSK